MNTSDNNELGIGIRPSKWWTATCVVTLHSKREKIGTGFGIWDNQCPERPCNVPRTGRQNSGLSQKIGMDGPFIYSVKINHSGIRNSVTTHDHYWSVIKGMQGNAVLGLTSHEIKLLQLTILHHNSLNAWSQHIDPVLGTHTKIQKVCKDLGGTVIFCRIFFTSNFTFCTLFMTMYILQIKQEKFLHRVPTWYVAICPVAKCLRHWEWIRSNNG